MLWKQRRYVTHNSIGCDDSTSVTTSQLQELNPKTLDVVSEWDMTKATKHYGEPWWYFSRLDVHGELKRAALSDDGLGTPPVCELGARVDRVDPFSGTVYLEDGRTFLGDIIIGADGIRATTGKSVFGDLTTSDQGLYAYRCSIKSQRLRDDPETASLVDCAKILMLSAPDRRIVAYPCSSWEIINIVGIYPDQRDRRLDWQTKVSVDEMVQTFDEFHPAIKKMLSMAEETGVWQLRDRDPLSTLVKDRYAMIGDAAHAMGPRKFTLSYWTRLRANPAFLDQGQGACQALEDAEGLRIVLKGATPDEARQRLEIFDELRLERVNKILEYSRIMAPRKINGNQIKSPTSMSREYSTYYWSYSVTKAGIRLMEERGYPIASLYYR